MKLACDVSDKINKIAPLYGMLDVDILEEFIANGAEESGEFQKLSENLNYSIDSLLKKFGRHRISVDQANRYGRKTGQSANQKAIANILYGGNFGRTQLGNTQPNDGWDMRGGGILQITGRSNYTLFTTYYNQRFGTHYTITEMAEHIRTDYNYAVHSACCVFAIAKKLIPLAAADSMKEIVKRINGGLMNYPKRMQYYERAKKYFA